MTKRSKHCDLEHMIQDNEGGTVEGATAARRERRAGDKRTSSKMFYIPGSWDDFEILRPPELPMTVGSASAAAASTEDDLVNDLMEENLKLSEKTRDLEEKLKEATKANEQWYRYNEKSTSAMDNMRKQVEELRIELADKKREYDELKEEMAAMKEKQLQTELRMVKDQLEYVQKKLRDSETERDRAAQGLTQEDWTCPRCTFNNTAKSDECEVCCHKVERAVILGVLEED